MGRKLLTYALAALLFAGCALMMLLPPPHALPRAGETYVCRWEDGTSTEEDFSHAYAALAGAAPEGVFLAREELRGSVAGSAAYRSAREALSAGDLAAMYALDYAGLTRLERAALLRSYGSTAYYADGAFRFTGEGVAEGGVDRFDRVALLIGKLPAHYLEKAGASVVFVGALARFSAEDLIGSRVEEIAAEAPYSVEYGALVLETAGGRRLVAVPAAATALTLPETAFSDEGALLPAERLVSLTLPYAGEALRPAPSRSAEFAWLFSDGDDYFVPASLKTVKITGGTIAPLCFYHCPQVETIDLCGIPANDVSPRAFDGALGLKELHTSRPDLTLSGFTKQVAPCGCTIYTRSIGE